MCSLKHVLSMYSAMLLFLCGVMYYMTPHRKRSTALMKELSRHTLRRSSIQVIDTICMLLLLCLDSSFFRAILGLAIRVRTAEMLAILLGRLMPPLNRCSSLCDVIGVTLDVLEGVGERLSFVGDLLRLLH